MFLRAEGKTAFRTARMCVLVTQKLSRSATFLRREYLSAEVQGGVRSAECEPVPNVSKSKLFARAADRSWSVL